MSRRQGPVKQEKVDYESRINDLLDSYKRILFVGFENVRSQQIHHIRRELRGKAVLCMGKKTLQRKVVANRAENSGTEMDKMLLEKSNRLSLLRGMSGLLFTNAEMDEINEVLQRHRIRAPARVGAIAPVDVVVPAGNTGMEPTQTSFFQALGIATKITKGTVEIISDKKVLSVGDKVDNSTAALLQKLNISPFFYSMEVKFMWDRGVVFTPEDLSITEADLQEAMVEGITNLTALSVGAEIPSAETFPLVAVDAFKNLLAASVGSDYVFSDFGADTIREDILSGKLAAAAPAAAAASAGAAAPAAAAAAKEEEEEEEDDFGMGGLF